MKSKRRHHVVDAPQGEDNVVGDWAIPFITRGDSVRADIRGGIVGGLNPLSNPPPSSCLHYRRSFWVKNGL